jgi:F-box/leucine-rich repeat protein 15
LDLAIKCKNLCHVDLAGCWDINDDAIITLISTNCNIQFLSLAKIYGITDKTVIQIAHRCRMLENLNLHGCWRITNDAVKALGDYCPSLRVLSIRENSNVTEFSLGPLRNRRIQVDVPPPPTGIRGLNLINPLFQQAMPQNFANMPPPNFMVIGDVAFQNHMNRM